MFRSTAHLACRLDLPYIHMSPTHPADPCSPYSLQHLTCAPQLAPLTQCSTHNTLPSAPTSPEFMSPPFKSMLTLAPPDAPWALPSLSLTLVARIMFFLPWCIAVSTAIVLHPHMLLPLVRMYAELPHMPLHRLAHHAHTAHAHVGIFVSILCLVASAPPCQCSLFMATLHHTHQCHGSAHHSNLVWIQGAGEGAQERVRGVVQRHAVTH